MKEEKLSAKEKAAITRDLFGDHFKLGYGLT